MGTCNRMKKNCRVKVLSINLILKSGENSWKNLNWRLECVWCVPELLRPQAGHISAITQHGTSLNIGRPGDFIISSGFVLD